LTIRSERKLSRKSEKYQENIIDKEVAPTEIRRIAIPGILIILDLTIRSQRKLSRKSEKYQENMIDKEVAPIEIRRIAIPGIPIILDLTIRSEKQLLHSLVNQKSIRRI